MIKYRKRSDGLYVCTETFRWYSTRYDDWVTIYEGTVRDGASGALDIRSSSWWVHDELCANAKWDSGRPVTAWQAANTIRDVLRAEGRLWRGYYWHWFTFLFGCKQARANGWFRSE